MNKPEIEKLLTELVLDFADKNGDFTVNDICRFFSQQKTFPVKNPFTGKTSDVIVSSFISSSKTRKCLSRLTKAGILNCVKGTGRKPSVYSLGKTHKETNYTNKDDAILGRIDKIEKRLHEIETSTWGPDLI